jgi:hypothetical protein
VRQWARYTLSVTLYIAISLFTKRLLAWNVGLLYYVVTLEVIPRALGRMRRGRIAGGG